MGTCKHFGTCGGCTYLDIPYSEELAQKEKALRDTLGPYDSLLEDIIPAPSSTAYRNKMELAFGDEGKDGNLALGIRKRRSFYEVATTEDCALIPEDFKKIAKSTQDYFRKTGEAFFHRKRHIGSLRHLVLRRGEFTGELLISLSTTSSLKSELPPLAAQLIKLPLDGQIVGILHSIHDGVADVVKNENTRILWGRDYFYEKICGLKFTISAYSFFQTNSAGAEKLYDVVKCMVPYKSAGAEKLYDTVNPMTPYESDGLHGENSTNRAGALAYDLYCGTGTIAQILSPYFDKVTGVELNPDAIISAKENAKLNGITNCEFYAGDVLEALGTVNQTPDITVVDPPRDGLHPKALAKLIALAPPRLIYVACKPASLVRDLAALTDAGYVPIHAVGVDMFPRTPHVELVMLMETK